MHAYGLFHAAWLAAISIAATALALLCRRKLVSAKVVLWVLALVVATGEIGRYIEDGLSFPRNVPLNLCNFTAWIAVWACFTLAPMAVEIVYFLGLSGAGLALLSPDMGHDWPPRFFITHGAIVACASVLIIGRVGRLRPGAVWRIWYWGVAYFAAIGIFNWAYGTNYSYMGRKPPTASLLDLMGPFPVYYFVAALFALGLFWLLWLPVRQHAAEAGA